MTRDATTREAAPMNSTNQSVQSRVGPQATDRADLGDGANRVFDDIARVLGSGMPRRAAFGIAAKGMAAAFLAQFGVRSAWAFQTCLCQGQVYNPRTTCCTASGRQQKNPISNLNACPNRVPHPGYNPVPNGCGAQGGTQFPNSFFAASFLQCCNNHDICWGTCNSNRVGCDNTFEACLTASCDAAYPGVLQTIQRNSCRGAANGYWAGVAHTSAGTNAYVAAQSTACDCCAENTCPQSCAGSSCGSLPACAPGGDCVCFTSTEGTGACVHGATPCSSVPRCTTTADCPSGYACLTTSCCGPFGVCGPLCNPLVPAPSVSPSSASRSSSAARARQGAEPTLGGF